MSGIDFGALLAEAEKSGGGAPPPPDTYDCYVEKADATKSASSQKTMFKCRFKIITGPQAGRIIFNNFVISPESAGALSFFFQHMGVLGLDRNFFASNPSPEQVAAALVGRQARLKIEHRDWNGKPQADVKEVLPPTPGVVAPVVTSATAAPAPAVPTTAAAPAPQAPTPVAPAAVPAPAAPPAPVAPAAIPQTPGMPSAPADPGF